PLGPDALHDRPRDVGAACDAQPGPVLKDCIRGEGDVTCRPALLAPIAITASLLGGCSNDHMMTAGEAHSAPVKTEDRTARPVAKATIGERLASARLDDGRLS